MISGLRRLAASRTIAAAALALAMTAGASCHLLQPMHPEPPLGRWYQVAPGETLSDIARRAGVPEEDLLEANGLHSAAEAHVGRMIFVLDPAGSPKTAEPPGTQPAMQPTGPVADAAGAGPVGGFPARFRWPVDAPRVTSPFGSRGGRTHEGIDLAAPIGTPVVAASAGQVVYAGNAVRGYGNMIVLRHPDDLMTVYAHNSVLLVKEGAAVKTGDRIALSGQSGHATGPHLHFEVRRAQVPRDPLQFLPGRTAKP